MASTFLGFSTTASSNTDVGGISIQGTAPVSNFDNAFREYAAILRRDLDGKSVYAAKSGNYTAVADDNNAVHRYTATATVSLTAAATLGANWHYTVVADGADVTIDPNGSETIDGSTTLVVPDGSSVLVICTGTDFRTAFASSDEVFLLRKWDAADLSGLTQILLDLPTGYTGFILKEKNVTLTTGTGGLNLQIGEFAGGSVGNGASDYNNVAATAGTSWTNSRLDSDSAFIRVLSTGPGQSVTEFTNGVGASWSFMANSGVFSGSNSLDVRYGTRNTSAFLIRRLRIGFGGTLASTGSIRLYGIR